MSAELKLRANLKRHAGGRETVVVETAPGLSLFSMIDVLGIPRNDIMLFSANGMRVPGDYVPADGDSIEVIPAITGG
jgi:molybdopterin converting factor small subunit